MDQLRLELRQDRRAWVGGILAALLLSGSAAAQLAPTGVAPPAGPRDSGPSLSAVEVRGAAAAAAEPDAQMVADVRVLGNEAVSAERIRRHIRTRRDRPLVVEVVEEDVRRLNSTRMFLDVKVLYQTLDDGRVVVIFQVVERPSLREVIYVGNTVARDKVLAKETGLKRGSPLDPFAIEDGRRKIEQFYQERGYSKVRVDIHEGAKPGERRVVYVINEGPKQKVQKIEFIGNTIASDARLKTQIDSRRPWFHVPYLISGYKGFVDPEKIESDVEKLKVYYRSLGFFGAKIEREIEYTPDQQWATLRFVIDEGIRYRIRSVAFVGNKKFSTDHLSQRIKLEPGAFFDQGNMDRDLQAIRDEYGGIGHVFADIQAQPRFDDEPGEMDLVYNISEGARAVVGRINIHIAGDHPHTKHTAILNQLSLQPGDTLDIRKLRDSERRLRASGLFEVNPTVGNPPRIAYAPPEVSDKDLDDRPRRAFRGQSPDPVPHSTLRPAASTEPIVYLDVNVYGELVPETDSAAGHPSPHSQPPAPPQTPPIGPHRVAPPMPYTVPPGYRTGTPQSSPSAAGATRWQSGQWQGEIDTNRLVIRGQSPGYHRWSERPQPRQWQPPRPEPQGWGSRGIDTSMLPGATTNSRTTGRPLADTTGEAPVFRGQYTPDDGRSPPLRPQPAPPPVYGQPQYGQPPQYGSTPQYGSSPQYGQQPQSTQQQPQYGQPVAPGSNLAPGTQATPPQATYPDGPPSYLDFGNRAPATSTGQPGGGYAPPGGAPPSDSYPPPPAGYDDAGELFPEWGNGIVEGEPPPIVTPIDIYTQETQTGRLMFGVGVNSDAGVIGSIVLDEQNFDWRRLPRSWEDIRNATAFRGAGQQLRIEAIPGTVVQRYLINFREPYLWDTPVSFGISAFLYDRRFFEWDEQRLGGRLTFGYQFAPDLSGTISLRGERVNIRNPILPTPGDIAEVLGDNELWGARAALTHDTRDSPFLATEGHRIELSFEQVFGQFDYSRGGLDASKFFLLHERPDRSGRHTLSLSTSLGISGTQTPVFEHYFAGGFSTLRGFRFRGASPREGDAFIGGEFQWINSAEYLFPITADDMLRGVVFCDFGTVERRPGLDEDNFRVAPGFGLRITVPAMGPAPIALDLAFPVARADGDRIQNFSFFVGFGR